MKRRLQVITHSEMEAYRKCPALHGFTYIEMLRPVHDAFPLRSGKISHDGMEGGWRAAWQDASWSQQRRLDEAIVGSREAIRIAVDKYKERLEAAADDPAQETPAERIEELVDETEQARDIALWSSEHYFQQCASDLMLVPLAIEAFFEFRVPNSGGRRAHLVHRGKWDLVLWDPSDNRIVVEDHKGTANEIGAAEAKMHMDPQLSGYVAAVQDYQKRRAFFDFDYVAQGTTRQAAAVAYGNRGLIAEATTGSVALNVSRRKVPSVPSLNLLKKGQVLTSHHEELLKLQQENGVPQGEVSVRQIDTLPEYYAKALAEQFSERELVVTEKQQALLEALKRKGDTYFAKHEYFRSGQEIDRWRAEIWQYARRMWASRQDPRQRTRNPEACCQPWSPPCAMAAVCLDPWDPETRAAFRKIENRHEELETAHGEEEEETND